MNNNKPQVCPCGKCDHLKCQCVQNKCACFLQKGTGICNCKAMGCRCHGSNFVKK